MITPNIPEAEILSGKRIKSIEDMKTSIEEISKKFEIENIVLKGGHLNMENKVYDLLYSENRFILFKKEYLKDQNIHGTGCLLSSILSFFLAQNLNIEKAFYETENLFQKIIKRKIKIGKGQEIIKL